MPEGAGERLRLSGGELLAARIPWAFFFLSWGKGGRGWRRFWDRPDGPSSSPRRLAHAEPFQMSVAGRNLKTNAFQS